MVIWSEFRMGQYRSDKHREDAPTLISNNLPKEETHVLPKFMLRSSCSLLETILNWVNIFYALDLNFKIHALGKFVVENMTRN